MIEHFTEALVINKRNSGETDNLITLYTADLGKVMAKAKGAKRIVSKLSAHLEPLNFISVRLIEGRGFQIADALTVDSQSILRRAPADLSKSLKFIQFIDDMTVELQPDRNFWLAIKKAMSNRLDDEKSFYRHLLKILGFDSEFAVCFSCHKKPVEYFFKEDQTFFCGQCIRKIPEDELILING